MVRKAIRMVQSSGMPDSIQVTQSVYERLKGLFTFEPRGDLDIKSKGAVQAWLLRI